MRTIKETIKKAYDLFCLVFECKTFRQIISNIKSISKKLPWAIKAVLKILSLSTKYNKCVTKKECKKHSLSRKEKEKLDRRMKRLENEIMEEIKYLPYLYASMGCIVALAMIILKFFTTIILVIGSGLILIFLVMLAALLVHKLRHIELKVKNDIVLNVGYVVIAAHIGMFVLPAIICCLIIRLVIVHFIDKKQDEQKTQNNEPSWCNFYEMLHDGIIEEACA